jgi:hypothetical protein
MRFSRRASTACKCFIKFRLLLIIKTTSNAHPACANVTLLLLKATPRPLLSSCAWRASPSTG